ncbi:DegV domain-containing protein [Anaerotignum neopropionicum]|uniref:DegV domain-containing protein n=1 Tax=Anaerotignum neopropionicum TaxID=36847 RepID=A0A136WE38_9FIRM|nr:DegV family protein [Anaerotignum neopropionicum]KXL52609.1 DegV domain-containing protein [Anaerotignum neopropionicum]
MVQIITDSTCDISHQRLEDIGVVCVPLTVHFGEKTFIDGENLTAKEFYEYLRTDSEIPTTAQPTPHSFQEAFQTALDKGDEVVCILISGKLSGTVQSAHIAKDALGSDKIWIVDTNQVCTSLGLLVEIAAKRVKEGATAKELYHEITELSSRAKIYAAIETLKYLRKGGRLSGTAAIVGTMLNLHPIVTVQDGLVLNTAKAKGKKKMISILKDLAKADGVDESYPFMFCHGAAEENLELARECFAEDYDISNGFTGTVGPVVGTYSGPGIVAIGFIIKK